MKSCSLALLLLVATVTVPSLFVNAINPLVIKGNQFFDSVTGHHVTIRGIDYYPRPNDGPLNDNSVDFFTNEHEHIWQRDVKHFKDLGINAIRLYSVDPTKDHDSFMCALAEAGIYVTVGIASKNKTEAVTKDESPKCYPPQLKERAETVINSFAKYPNVMAFSMGNEVNHVVTKPGMNAPCQKKLIADMRKYVASCTTIRNVPIGLVIADSDRLDNLQYYNCQHDPQDDYEHAEWYGLNAYLGCDVFNTSYIHSYKDSAGFAALATDLNNLSYSIPIVLSEFGCLNKGFPTVDGFEGQRTFQQARWLWEDKTLSKIFAGGFAFEYAMEKANGPGAYPFKNFTAGAYGIGYFSPEHCDDIKIPCKYNPMPAFDNLKKAYDIMDSSHMNQPHIDDYKVVNTQRSKCPADFPSIHSFRWAVDRIKNRSDKCPAKERQQQETNAITAKCPAFKYEHKEGSDKWQTSTATETNKNKSNNKRSWFPLSVFVGIIAFIMGWGSEKLYKYCCNRKEGYEPISFTIDDVDVAKGMRRASAMTDDEESGGTSSPLTTTGYASPPSSTTAYASSSPTTAYTAFQLKSSSSYGSSD